MAKEPLFVIDRGQQVPFLRGMITHSLMERGLTFQEAYDTASLVRDRLKRRKKITKEELSRLIERVLQERFGQKGMGVPSRSKPTPPAILVQESRTSVPFSKGILSQSLQATGLEPSLAYDIARDIEAYLIKSRRREISRDGLRRLIYETILHNYDSAVAERYLLWRCFKAPDKPLLILFGGATGVGKSSVAAEVAHRLGIQKIVSTDTIRQILRMMFSHDLLPAIHYSSYDAWQERISREQEEKSVAVIQAFKDQTIRVLVGVRAMMERAVRENSSLVIDGVHLVPGLIDLTRFQSEAYVLHLMLSTLDRDIYLERFPKREEWSVDRKSQRYVENFGHIWQIQDYLLEMARQTGTPIVENLHFDDTVAAILATITNTLRQKLNLEGPALLQRALG